MLIKTVGGLIAELEMHDREHPVRVLTGPGRLDGICAVRNVAGRVTICPAENEQRKTYRD